MATTDEHLTVAKDALALAIEEAKRPENRVSVSDRLRSPPQLVREAKDFLKDATPNDLGILECPYGCLDIRVSRGQLSRALRIADALVRVFDRRGWEVAVQPDGTFVQVDDVPIAVTIEESLARDVRAAAKARDHEQLLVSLQQAGNRATPVGASHCGHP